MFNLVSLDGFFEGPNHELDWFNVNANDAEFTEFANNQLNEIDVLLFGRKTYEMMASFWPTESALRDQPVTAERMNSLPKLVCSKTLEKVEWNNSRLVKNNIAEEISKLKEQPGKNIAMFGSSDLSEGLIQMGVIDEFRIMVNPVILGNGKPLFKGIKEKLKLKLLKTRTFSSGNVLLCYEPENAPSKTTA